MGKYRNGIMGAFSGKVGPVVGSSWNCKPYMRAYTNKVRNPRTLGQRMQRSRMGLAVKFVKPIRSVLNIGWSLYAVGMTPANAATRHLLANAISGDYPNYGILPSGVLISCGSLTPAFEVELGASDNYVLVKWTDNSGVGSALGTDKCLVAVVNRSRGEAVCIPGGTARSTGRQEVVVPAVWVNSNVDCYLGFVSEDGKDVANSVYVGSITIIG